MKSEERRPKIGDEQGAVRRRGQCGGDQNQQIRQRNRGDGGGPPLEVDMDPDWDSQADTEAWRFGKPGTERVLPTYTVD